MSHLTNKHVIWLLLYFSFAPRENCRYSFFAESRSEVYRSLCSHISLLKREIYTLFISSLFFRVFFRVKMRGFDDRGSHGGDVINIHPEDHLFPYIALWQGCYQRRRCYHSSCRSFFIGLVLVLLMLPRSFLVEARRRLGEFLIPWNPT